MLFRSSGDPDPRWNSELLSRLYSRGMGAQFVSDTEYDLGLRMRMLYNLSFPAPELRLFPPVEVTHGLLHYTFPPDSVPDDLLGAYVDWNVEIALQAHNLEFRSEFPHLSPVRLIMSSTSNLVWVFGRIDDEQRSRAMEVLNFEVGIQDSFSELMVLLGNSAVEMKWKELAVDRFLSQVLEEGDPEIHLGNLWRYSCAWEYLVAIEESRVFGMFVEKLIVCCEVNDLGDDPIDFEFLLQLISLTENKPTGSLGQIIELVSGYLRLDPTAVIREVHDRDLSFYQIFYLIFILPVGFDHSDIVKIVWDVQDELKERLVSAAFKEHYDREGIVKKLQTRHEFEEFMESLQASEA